MPAVANQVLIEASEVVGVAIKNLLMGSEVPAPGFEADQLVPEDEV